MKIKFGVKVEGLNSQILIILPMLEDLMRYAGSELVITSALEGVHMKNSLHYVGLAVDIRLPYTQEALNCQFVKTLQLFLGKDFDVVLEGDHIHIEFDND